MPYRNIFSNIVKKNIKKGPNMFLKQIKWSEFWIEGNLKTLSAFNKTMTVNATRIRIEKQSRNFQMRFWILVHCAILDLKVLACLFDLEFRSLCLGPTCRLAQKFPNIKASQWSFLLVVCYWICCYIVCFNCSYWIYSICNTVFNLNSTRCFSVLNWFWMILNHMVAIHFCMW